jgi:hypothetical protein
MSLIAKAARVLASHRNLCMVLLGKSALQLPFFGRCSIRISICESEDSKFLSRPYDVESALSGRKMLERERVQ